MEPLENVLLCILGNWSASVTDGQHHLDSIFSCCNSDAASRSIVLACVLQKILHDKRSIELFAGNIYFGWKLFLDSHIGRVGQRAEVIQPFFDKLPEIYWLGFDLKMAGIEPR